MEKTIERECPNCGKVFTQETGKPGNKFKYCSDRCRIDYWIRQDHLKRKAEHEQKSEKNCPNCNNKFREEFGKSKKFCSQKCKNQYHSRISPEKIIYREISPTCPNCGRRFEKPKGKGGYQRFCCGDCRKKYWKDHWHIARHGVVSRFVCKNCGKEFESYGKNPRKFCGDKCREKYFENLKEDIVCPVCAKIFVASKNQNRIFCSKKCAGVFRTNIERNNCNKIFGSRVEILEKPGLLPPEIKCLQAPDLTEPIWVFQNQKVGKRIILVCKPLSFWHGWAEHLCFHVQKNLEMDPISGDIFVFCNKNRTELRLLRWSGAGFEILSKKLGFGHFPWPKTNEIMREIEENDFRLLLEYPRFMMRLNEKMLPEKIAF
jgi:endogenous inhibitor of DNA gyrase (YacG/DUF329 family)